MEVSALFLLKPEQLIPAQWYWQAKRDREPAASIGKDSYATMVPTQKSCTSLAGSITKCHPRQKISGQKICKPQ